MAGPVREDVDVGHARAATRMGGTLAGCVREGSADALTGLFNPCAGSYIQQP